MLETPDIPNNECRWQLAQMPEVGYVIKNYCAAEMLSRLTGF